jgi:hypothetical protein
MRKKTAFRNKSPTGWWIASYIERPVWKGEKKPLPRHRCLAWENTIILKAPSRDAAYKKALKLASQNQSAFSNEKDRNTGQWKLMGLTDLLPLYEPLEDGAEILWSERKTTFAALTRRVKKKNQLGVFDDTPAIGDRNGKR